MDFKLEISRDNSPNSYYKVDLFPKQQLDYDVDFYDTIEIDKVKIPFYTDLRIPLTTNNKSQVVFDYEPVQARGRDFPKQDFFFILTIYGSQTTTISGILNVTAVEYNSGEPYLTVVLKDFISKYLAEIKDLPLGTIYSDNYYTSRNTFNNFRAPTSSNGEAGIIGQNPDYSRPISFPYVDFVNDVRGKFGYAARQFVEYATGVDRTGMMPVYSVKGFLQYLASYIQDTNFQFRIDSQLFGLGGPNGSFDNNPFFPDMSPEKIHMLIPSQLLAKQDAQTNAALIREFFVRQSPAWAGTNESFESEYDYDGNVKLITTGYFGNMETAGNYGSKQGEDPAIYDIQAWGAEKRLPFYPDDNDEGIRGFFAPKVSFNADVVFNSGNNFCTFADAELEIPIVGKDKLVQRIYSLSAQSTMRFKPYIGIFEDGFMVKKIALQDVGGTDIVLTMNNVTNVKTGYSNKDTASAPYDYFDASDEDPSIIGAAAVFYDTLVFENFNAYLPETEMFMNGGSRYSINYFIEPLDGELDINVVTAYNNANPHQATAYQQTTFGVDDIGKAITRLGTPDGSSGSYGTANIKFTANEDVLIHKLSDEFIIQESILKTCDFTVSEVLINIAKRFDCSLFYDYDNQSQQHILRIDPIFLLRQNTVNINQYVDDLKSFKITNQGDKVKILSINNEDFGLYYDDLNNDNVTVGSTTQEINEDGIAELTIDLKSSIYNNSVCGEVSEDTGGNQNFQNGAFSEKELGFTPNLFTKNKDIGFRFAYLDKPLYRTNLLRPEIVLKGLRNDDKMITEIERVYVRSELGQLIFNGRLFSYNTNGWSLMFEDEGGNVTDTYTEIFLPSEKIRQSDLPKIEFDMVVPTSELGSLNFFLDKFTNTAMTQGTILVKSANGEVFEDYAYLTIEGILE